MNKTILPLTVIALMFVLCSAGFRAAAQQAKQKPAAQTPATPAAPAPTAPPARPAISPEDAAKKTEILNSPQWRRAMFEFKEWLSAQPFYSAQQVADLKARFNQRVAAMTAQELGFLLADMQAKFQVLDSPEAQDARAWVAQYLSVMSDKKRAEVLKQLPNPATMTAGQLNAALAKLEAKRATIEDEQAAFDRTRQAQVSAQLQQDRTARQDYIRDRNSFPTSAYSPYRSPSDVNARLNRGNLGSGMSYYVGAYGGFGINFSPSSF